METTRSSFDTGQDDASSQLTLIDGTFGFIVVAILSGTITIVLTHSRCHRLTETIGCSRNQESTAATWTLSLAFDAQLERKRTDCQGLRFA